MITVTDLAIKKIKQTLARRGHGLGIRVAVRTTGCSGLAYVLEYADAVGSSDELIMIDGFHVVVDQKAIPYLQGTTIDYVRNGLNEGFEFLNPNERDRCGCGESFRV
jgi:iron-sulfur cluster assembly protein